MTEYFDSINYNSSYVPDELLGVRITSNIQVQVQDTSFYLQYFNIRTVVLGFCWPVKLFAYLLLDSLFNNLLMEHIPVCRFVDLKSE